MALARTLAQHVFRRCFQLFNTGFFQLANMTSSNTTTFFNDHVAFAIFDIKAGSFTTQTLRHQFQA